MATRYSPAIVTSGLVLCLDSTNPKSYSGTGTTWYDLSGYGNHATMTNFTGPSAGSTSGFDTNTKYMMFDRHLGAGDGTSNNVATVANTSVLDECLCENGMSVSMWLKVTSSVCTAMTKWNGSWEIYYCTPLTFRTQGTGGNDGISTYLSTNYVNVWSNIISTHNGTTRKIYFNGVEIFSDTNIVTGQNTTSVISIGAYENGTYAFVGAMPVYYLYNRALSATEVIQNYQALKSRFGL